jgi:ABC-2 type transport system ATP-binding protein
MAPAMRPSTTPTPACTATAAANHAALAVQGLRKQYGSLLAVDEVSFSVPRGQIVGLLGPNGAGKTSTINMILGILQPTSGNIRIEGLDLAERRSEALAHTNFAAVYASLPGNLTVRQNLRFFALLYNVADCGRRIERLLEEFELRALADTRCGLLSSGEQTRLALAKALLNEPRLLLLDEPTASLDPSAADLIRKRIRAMARERHCGILWTSHNMYEVQSTCDRVLFLSHGRVLLEGDPRRLPAEHGAATLDELFIRLTREPLGLHIASAPDAMATASRRGIGS